jgi:hypothetical protein
MTGAEHYEKAISLKASTEDWDVTNPEHQPIIANLLAEAQVEATLSVAAFQREQWAGNLVVEAFAPRP